MKPINFNGNFSGFENGEDILLDTGILLAYLNKYDPWSTTVNKLFENHVLNNDNELYLYINVAILNEITNLIGKNKPIEEYKKKHENHGITDDEIIRVEKDSIEQLKMLLESDVIQLLDMSKEGYLNQLELYKSLGAADAINASIANEHGISFLTVDNKLVNNIGKNSSLLSNIHNLYYTHSEFKDY
jgi:predicted nucleic acid-binding protein